MKDTRTSRWGYPPRRYLPGHRAPRTLPVYVVRDGELHPPLPEGHEYTRVGCAVCGDPLGPNQVTLIATGDPDPQDQDVATVPAHAQCVHAPGPSEEAAQAFLRAAFVLARDIDTSDAATARYLVSEATYHLGELLPHGYALTLTTPTAKDLT